MVILIRSLWSCEIPTMWMLVTLSIVLCKVQCVITDHLKIFITLHILNGLPINLSNLIHVNFPHKINEHIFGVDVFNLEVRRPTPLYKTQSVHLQRSWTMVRAWLIHVAILLQNTCRGNWINDAGYVASAMTGGDMHLLSLLVLDHYHLSWDK